MLGASSIGGASSMASRSTLLTRPPVPGAQGAETGGTLLAPIVSKLTRPRPGKVDPLEP